MNELRAILDELAGADADDDPAVLATVVRVRGSAYRGPGARRLLRRDGTDFGLVSGGCLEADLARRAWHLTEGGRSALVRYDSTDPDDPWAFGLGCRGVIDILLDRVEGPSPLPWAAFLRDRQTRHEPAVLARVLGVGEGEGRARLGSFAATGRDGAVLHDIGDPSLATEIASASKDVLGGVRAGDVTFDGPGQGVAVVLELVEPPPTLIVCGAGPDALPVVAFARKLGWSVAVVDGRHRTSTRSRFAEADEVMTVIDARRLLALASRPKAAAVVMAHDLAEDARFLELLLPSPVAYVGLLGPGHRAERLLARLGPIDGSARAKLHAPVGLDLGGDAPVEIALAIVSEVQAALAGRLGGPLRDRCRPIHDRGESSWPSGPEREVGR